MMKSENILNKQSLYLPRTAGLTQTIRTIIKTIKKAPKPQQIYKSCLDLF